MTAKRRRTEADYEAAADSYEAEPIRPDEVRSIEISPALRMGRPTKGAESSGKTPTVPVRFPDPIRVEIAHRVEAGEAASASELIRTAVVEYFEHHPSKAG